MHDIRIFLEDNGKFGAVATFGKERIYGVGDTKKDLIESLKNGIEFSNSHISASQIDKLQTFFQTF